MGMKWTKNRQKKKKHRTLPWVLGDTTDLYNITIYLNIKFYWIKSTLFQNCKNLQFFTTITDFHFMISKNMSLPFSKFFQNIPMHWKFVLISIYPCLTEWSMYSLSYQNLLYFSNTNPLHPIKVFLISFGRHQSRHSYQKQISNE